MQGTIAVGGDVHGEAGTVLMSDYRPKLPSNNAYDYYITAARQLKGGEHFSNLMLIHLRLREYRLREGRYPDSLEPLNLQELAIDPFTGQPFVYRLIGERYQLESSV